MIEARIGGDGTTVPRLTAVSPDDRVAMIDQYLAEHTDEVMFVEVKRDDPRSWDEWKDDANHIEFMQVGVAGDRAAAQYVRGGFHCADPVVQATFNAEPLPDEPRVPYDQVLGWHFPVDTVLPLGQVRRLMIDFVLTGEWSDAVPWREHDNLVG